MGGVRGGNDANAPDAAAATDACEERILSAS
jgi:hypothetical protein